MESPLYEPVCQYAGCGKTFQSKRRWVKKYCSDSCRTLASRYRQNGMGGSNIETPRSKGVKDLFQSTEEFQAQLTDRFKTLESLFTYVHVSAKNTENASEQHTAAVAALHDKLTQAMHQQELAVMKLGNQLQTMQTELKALSLAVSDVRNKQSSQDLVVVLSSILGPHVIDTIESAVKTNDNEQSKRLEEFLKQSDKSLKKNHQG